MAAVGTPLRQTSSAPTSWPHPPQCIGEVLVSVHVTRPMSPTGQIAPAHVALPSSQRSPGSTVALQPPQCSGLQEVSTHTSCPVALSVHGSPPSGQGRERTTTLSMLNPAAPAKPDADAAARSRVADLALRGIRG